MRFATEQPFSPCMFRCSHNCSVQDVLASRTELLVQGAEEAQPPCRITCRSRLPAHQRREGVVKDLSSAP